MGWIAGKACYLRGDHDDTRVRQKVFRIRSNEFGCRRERHVLENVRQQESFELFAVLGGKRFELLRSVGGETKQSAMPDRVGIMIEADAAAPQVS